MTDYGYIDPRSIFSEENIKEIRRRKPKEILDKIKEMEQ